MPQCLQELHLAHEHPRHLWVCRTCLRPDDSDSTQPTVSAVVGREHGSHPPAPSWSRIDHCFNSGVSNGAITRVAATGRPRRPGARGVRHRAKRPCRRRSRPDVPVDAAPHQSCDGHPHGNDSVVATPRHGDVPDGYRARMMDMSPGPARAPPHDTTSRDLIGVYISSRDGYCRRCGSRAGCPTGTRISRTALEVACAACASSGGQFNSGRIAQVEKGVG
jgi:hypothetical protein